jgi:Mrp family chromosome partitioning ATPase
MEFLIHLGSATPAIALGRLAGLQLDLSSGRAMIRRRVANQAELPQVLADLEEEGIDVIGLIRLPSQRRATQPTPNASTG